MSELQLPEGGGGEHRQVREDLHWPAVRGCCKGDGQPKPKQAGCSHPGIHTTSLAASLMIHCLFFNGLCVQKPRDKNSNPFSTFPKLSLRRDSCLTQPILHPQGATGPGPLSWLNLSIGGESRVCDLGCPLAALLGPRLSGDN